MKQRGMKLLPDAGFSFHHYMRAWTKERLDAFERPRASHRSLTIPGDLKNSRIFPGGHHVNS
jgi:hypothetical protein